MMPEKDGEGGGRRFGGIWRWAVVFLLWWFFWLVLMLAGRQAHRVTYFVLAIGGTLVLLLSAGSEHRVRAWLRWYNYESMYLEPVKTFLVCVFTLMLASSLTYRDPVAFEVVYCIGLPVMLLLTARAWKRRKAWNAEQRFLKYVAMLDHDVSSQDEVLDAFYWVVDVLDGDAELARPSQTVDEYLATIRVRFVKARQDLHDAMTALSDCGLVIGENELLALTLGELVRRVVNAGCHRAPRPVGGTNGGLRE